MVTGVGSSIRLWRLVLLAVGALACRGASPAPDLAVPPLGMPTLQRRVLAIADSELPDDQYGPMGVNERGQIIYANSGAHAPIFRVIDSNGHRLFAFGREGDGPGEFRSAGNVQVRGDSVRIFDDQRMMMLHYLLNGKSDRDIRSLMLDIPLEWVGDSVDHWVPPGFTRTERSVIRRTLVGDSAGRVLIPESDPGFKAVLASPPNGKRLMRISYAATPTRTYIADAWHYRIYSYDRSGRLIASFGRTLPPHHRGPRELATERAGLIELGKPMQRPDGKMTPGPDQRARLDTLAREVTAHFNQVPLHVDALGRLWVIGTANDATTVDVFSDTTFIGRTVLPCYLTMSGFPVALAGHWLLLECQLPEAADRASELQLYRIVEATRRP